jgi:hypothetical protein
MQTKFKTLFTLALVASSAQAKEQRFFSGFGVTLGAGVTTSGTKGNNGAGGPISGITGFKHSTPAVAGRPVGVKDGVGNGRGVKTRDRAGNRIAILDRVDRDPVTQYGPAVPAGVRNIGTPNSFIDFTSPASVKNNSGFAFVGGLFAQHVSPSGFTMGGRWLFGRSGASSTLKYKSGPLLLDEKSNPAGTGFNAALGIAGNDTQSFRLKDKCFTVVIADFGYSTGPIQCYIGPGLALHRQKLFLVNSFGKVAGGVTKTVASPVFAVGTRYAMSKRMSVGFEWQRHFGGKKTWHNVSKIAPEGMQSFGAPTTNMNNNIFLITANYVFCGK